MTKTLVLLRHAKSSWSESGLDDIERPLNRRGARAALVIGLYLKQESVRPDLVLCSAARRTRETWDAVRPYLPRNQAFERSPAIYEAPVERLFETFRSVDDAVGTLMVIGHNPGLQRVTLALCQGAGNPELERARVKFPTGALAFIEIDIPSWTDLAPGTGRLNRFVTPKDLV